MANRGVGIVTADLNGPTKDLEEALSGVDIVISTIYGGNLMDEIPLMDASKSVGIKRYLPCFFATVAPPKGALRLRDMVVYLTNSAIDGLLTGIAERGYSQLRQETQSSVYSHRRGLVVSGHLASPPFWSHRLCRHGNNGRHSWRRRCPFCYDRCQRCREVCCPGYRRSADSKPNGFRLQ